MLTVHLTDLLFYAYHGVYEGENIVGGEYLVNLHVSYEEGNASLDNLENMIDYEALYDIVKKRMAVASPLLEEIAAGIIRKVRHRYSNARSVSVSIYKLHPPIEGFQGKAGITLHRSFEGAG